MVHCIYLGVAGYNSKNIEFLSLKFFFVLTNSADPDEILHYAAFHWGLHYLSKYMYKTCFIGYYSPMFCVKL